MEFLGFHSGRVQHWISHETKIYLLPSFWGENITFHFNKEFNPALTAVRDFRHWCDPSTKQHLYSIFICFMHSWYQFIKYQFYLSGFTATTALVSKEKKRERASKARNLALILKSYCEMLTCLISHWRQWVSQERLLTQGSAHPSRAWGWQCPPQG